MAFTGKTAEILTTAEVANKAILEIDITSNVAESNEAGGEEHCVIENTAWLRVNVTAMRPVDRLAPLRFKGVLCKQSIRGGDRRIEGQSRDTRDTTAYRRTSAEWAGARQPLELRA